MRLPAHATAREALDEASNFFRDSRLLQDLKTFEVDALEIFELQLEGSSVNFLAFGHFEKIATTDEIARLRNLLNDFKETDIRLVRRGSTILKIIQMMDI